MEFLIVLAPLVAMCITAAYYMGVHEGRRHRRRHSTTSEPRLLGRGYRTTTEKMNSQLPEDTQ